jgi:dTDP-4-amino-4,6-dideoxygalactose transaminase
MPVLVGPEFQVSRDELCEQLRAQGVLARRYFHPLISDFPMYRQLPSADRARLPVAVRASAQVLCLPMYPGMSDADVEHVAALVQAAEPALMSPALAAA